MARKYKEHTKVETQQKIDKIRSETNLKKALEGIVELFNLYVKSDGEVNCEGETYVRWDPKTKKYLPEIYLGGEGLEKPSLKAPGLAREVVNAIKSQSPILLNTIRFGTYVFSYEERDEIGSEHGGGTYRTITHLISMKRINSLV